MCVSVHAHTCMHTCVRAHTRIWARARAHTLTDTRTCVCVCARANTCARTHALRQRARTLRLAHAQPPLSAATTCWPAGKPSLATTPRATTLCNTPVAPTQTLAAPFHSAVAHCAPDVAVPRALVGTAFAGSHRRAPTARGTAHTDWLCAARTHNGARQPKAVPQHVKAPRQHR